MSLDDWLEAAYEDREGDPYQGTDSADLGFLSDTSSDYEYRPCPVCGEELHSYELEICEPCQEKADG